MQGNCTESAPTVSGQLPLPPLMPGQCVLQVSKRFVNVENIFSANDDVIGQWFDNLLLRARPDNSDPLADASSAAIIANQEVFSVNQVDDSPAVWFTNVTVQGLDPEASDLRSVVGLSVIGCKVVLQGVMLLRNSHTTRGQVTAQRYQVTHVFGNSTERCHDTMHESMCNHRLGHNQRKQALICVSHTGK